MRFAYSTNAYTRRPLAEAIRDVKARGFDGVEILADSPHAFPDRRLDARALKAVLAETGLPVVNLNGNTTLGLDAERRDPEGFWPGLLDPDAATRALKVDYLRRLLDLARLLGSPAVCTASGRRPAGTSERDADSRLRDGLASVLDYASRAPAVRLGIEYEPGFHVGSMEPLLRLIDDLKHPLLGVNLDLGHAVCVGEDPAAAIAAFGPRIWNVHLEDIRGRVHEHLVPGRGDVDFAAIGDALRAAGYAGHVTLELYPYKDDPGAAGEEGLRHCRRLMAPATPAR